MGEHTLLAYDLPPSQQIGTTLSAIDRHIWRDRLGPFYSHKLASGLVLEDFGSSCTLELVKESKEYRYSNFRQNAIVMLLPLLLGV